MLDFGWAELFVVMAVAVFVIGPKDIPQVMRAIGKMFRRFQYMKHAISQQFDQIMHDVDVTDVNFEASRAPAEHPARPPMRNSTKPMRTRNTWSRSRMRRKRRSSDRRDRPTVNPSFD